MMKYNEFCYVAKIGVYFVNDRTLRCSFAAVKCKFIRAFDAIIITVGRFASGNVMLSL
jgi:hypothetical protein